MWRDPSWLLQSLAISRIRNSLLTINQAFMRIHKQANMWCVKVLSCVCACAQISRVGKQQCATRYKQWWNHNFAAMKNRTTSNSAQTWVTKRVNHHSTYPDLFAGNHLLYAQKPVSEMLRHRAVYWDDCTAVWIVCTTWFSPVVLNLFYIYPCFL